MAVTATVPILPCYQNLAAWVIETIQKHFFLTDSRGYADGRRKST